MVVACWRSSENVTAPLFDGLGGFEGGQDGLVEDVLEALLGEGRTLDVLDGLELARQLLALVDGDDALLVLGQLLDGGGVVAQVDLRADQQEGRLLAVVRDLGHPLLFDVLERRRRHHREADEEDVRLRVAERPQPVVVLLAGRVEQAQRVRLAADHHRHRVVVEHLQRHTPQR